jgi:hypothetical protein
MGGGLINAMILNWFILPVATLAGPFLFLLHLIFR